MLTSHELVCRQFLIASRTEECSQVLSQMTDELNARGYSGREVFGVRLAIEEALVNAIKHGNGGDPSKGVQIAFHIDDQEASISITDEGDGFCVVDVPDPTQPDYIGRPCGRGILLMRSFMTTVKYNDQGNSVMMTLRRSDAIGND